jgi:hypothetical protein
VRYGARGAALSALRDAASARTVNVNDGATLLASTTTKR